MIEAHDFTEQLAKIGIAVRQPADAATLAVYHDVIGPHTDAEEWRRFVQWALERGRWRWFPKTAEIQDALREFRGHRPLMVEAAQAYDRVLSSGTYTPEGGTTWSYRALKASCGDAAAEAFLAAGGHSAFATTQDEARRRERFLAGYCEAVREDAAAGLLPPAPPQRWIQAGEPADAKEAAALLDRISREAAQRAPGITAEIEDGGSGAEGGARAPGFTRVIP